MSATLCSQTRGAQNAGYADVGAMWRSRYDMPEDAFAAETERLWEQVKPLYEALHCYTRMKLRQTYGNRVPEAGPIPAHLLGNMWAQNGGTFSRWLHRRGRRSHQPKSEVCAEEDDPLSL